MAFFSALSKLARPISTRRALAATGMVSGCLALPAAGQTLHQIDLFSVSFSPNTLTIQQGDTVRWRWVTGTHNVISGETNFQAYFPDGIFNTGQPMGGNQSFEFTFDGAVISNFPKPNDTYPYFCEVHLPVMIGTITVSGLSGAVTRYGSANPDDSLRFVKGDARVGKPMTFEVDNPVDPSSGPGLALVFVATAPDPNFPSGTSVPGIGMAGPSAAGDFLLSLAPPNPVLKLGPKAWGGSGSPTSFLFPLPNNPALVGIDLYLQGATVDPLVVNGIGVTNGLQVSIGS